jgi:ubiquinone/menaquinone biosynthesis C-methylase UbiE
MDMEPMLDLIGYAFSRNRSAEDYRAMQRYFAEATLSELEERGIHLKKLTVLELGAGSGGYSQVLHQAAEFLVSSDLHEEPIFEKLNIPFVLLNVLDPLPFKSEFFDFVYCSSLIEHVSDPDKLLSESWRVLKPGGSLYLSFPPFYSLFLIGGHTFKPFHLLGEDLAISITNLLYKADVKTYATCYGDYGLFPLKVDQVKQLLKNNGFEVSNVYTRTSEFNTTRLPGLLKDLATWHVCYLARKLV